MVDKLVCYCFHHTEKDIVRDAKIHGRSTILEQILAAKNAGGCQCATKNPKGC
ncbi:MAG: bacterioferritin-associated ferredoxin [Desulfobulbaceae bacterium]